MSKVRWRSSLARCGLCLALLTGCEDDILVKVDRSGDQVSASFHEAGWIRDRPIQPCISRLTVHRQSPPRETVWDISDAAGACSPLPRVSLGEVPRGFDEKVAFESFHPGETYSVEIIDGGGGFGGSEDWVFEAQ